LVLLSGYPVVAVLAAQEDHSVHGRGAIS